MGLGESLPCAVCYIALNQAEKEPCGWLFHPSRPSQKLALTSTLHFSLLRPPAFLKQGSFPHLKLPLFIHVCGFFFFKFLVPHGCLSFSPPAPPTPSPVPREPAPEPGYDL